MGVIMITVVIAATSDGAVDLHRDMEKNTNPTRKNRTRTHVLPRTEPKPEIKNVQESEPTLTRKELNSTQTQMSSFLLVLILSLNEIVGTFTQSTVNEAFCCT